MDDPDILQAYQNRVQRGEAPEGFYEGVSDALDDMGMYPEFKLVFQSVRVG